MPQQTNRMQDLIRVEMAMSPQQQSGNCCRFEILQARRNCATAQR